MKRHFGTVALLALGLGLAAATGTGSPETRNGHAGDRGAGDGSGDGGRAAPSGEVCATGCSAASYADPELGQADFARLLATWSAEPDSEEGHLALDTLLFHGPRTEALAWRAGFGALDPERARFLARELERDHAWLSLRLVDGTGAERLRLDPTRVPLGEKQHVLASWTADLQPPEVSGTVKRVGLSHLWVRL